MALSKRYLSVQGEIVGEKASGSSRIDYLTDALGSVTATVDQNAQVVNTYRYKPYGAQLAKSGAGADPRFRWVGSWGYRQTGVQVSDTYVRARHYSTILGRWCSEDPLYLGSTYGEADPTGTIDPSGLIPVRFEFNAFINKRIGKFHNGRYWTAFPFGWVFKIITLPHIRAELWASTNDRGHGEPGTSKHTSWATCESAALGDPSACNTAVRMGTSAVLIVRYSKFTGEQLSSFVIPKLGVYRMPPVHFANRLGPCANRAVFLISACTGFLPASQRSRKTCIDYQIFVDFFVVAPGRVGIRLQGNHDMFPDYEALVLAPGPRKLFWRYTTPFKAIDAGGLDIQTGWRQLSYTEVDAPTPPCCE